MYLPAMLFFSLLAPLAAFKGMVAFQLAVAALSTYVFARVLGMGAMASLVAAVVYLTGPFLHWNTYCCLIFGQFGTWIPLALLGIELSLRAARWRDRIAAWFLGGFAVSQMLAGWIGEGWLYAMLLPAAYIGYRALISPPRSGRSLRERLAGGVTTGVGVLGSGLALAAAGMLPRYTVNAETNLAGGDYAALGEAGCSTRRGRWTICSPRPWGGQRLSLPGGVPGRCGCGPRAIGAADGTAAVCRPLLRRADPCRHDPDLDTTPLHQLFYLIPRYREFHDHDAWRTMALAAIGPAMLSGAAIESLPRWRGRRDLLPIVFVPLLFVVVVAIALWQAGVPLGWQPLVAATLTTALIAVAVAIPFQDSRAASGERLQRRGQDVIPRNEGFRHRRASMPSDEILTFTCQLDRHHWARCFRPRVPS